jgi:hypothetical protein
MANPPKTGEADQASGWGPYEWTGSKMNNPAETQDVDQEPAVRNYIFLCLTALVVLFLVLVRRGLGGWSFLPVLVGVAGVGLRWRLAPLMSLILVTGLLYYLAPAGEGGRVRQHDLDRSFRLEDWILSATILAFFAAHYRLQGLTVSVFPQDPRHQEEEVNPGGKATQPPAGSELQRIPSLVSPSEIGWLILSLPIWAFLAQFCWVLLPSGERPEYELKSREWRGIVAVWVLGLGLWLVYTLLDLAGRRRMTPQEARLVLQDALWRETSRDQRRVNRWLAWASLRRRPRKEIL